MIQNSNGIFSTRAEPTEAALPDAQSGRWQPLRSILVNIYRYDYEEFRFEQGRILLRGHNGTGKSRLLALQLPFLLDGEIASHRLEPDGDPAKRMEWNLLLGKYPDRLGYTCIEFGRKDEDGATHYLTLGCGLQAVEHKGIHGRWLFITRQRVGRDLFLVNAKEQPLGKAKLEEAIEGHGEVFTSAEEYRRAVDRELFRLGTRYDTLVELLIRLRQPKLSRTLDEQQLSDALSEALPPIAEKVLGDVAEAFGTLETERRRVEDFKSAHEGVEEFLAEYRSYVQIAARRRAEAVRSTHSDYETTQRRLRKAEADHEEAVCQLKMIEARIAEIKEQEHAANERVQTLASSPQMRDAHALDEARRQAEERLGEVERAEQEHKQATSDRAQFGAESEAARQEEASVWATLQAAIDDSRKTAETIGLAADHQAAIDRIGLPETASDKVVEAARKTLDDSLSKRRKAIAHLKEANRAVELAETAVRSAKGIYSGLEAELTQAAERQRNLQNELQRAADALCASYQSWCGGLRVLRPDDLEVLEDGVRAWCESGVGENLIAESVRSAARTALDAISNERAERQNELLLATERLRELREAHERIEAGHHEPPPPPHTREPDLRLRRAGAPLWALCDFHPAVPEQDRAAIEAALEAAGLLDAWVTPDGQLLGLDEHDTVIVSGASALPPDDRHLGLALVPSIDSGDGQASISETTVVQVLRQVGFGKGSGSIHVDADGRWQLGPLHGVWSKPLAQHIGRAARDAQRQRRLVELSAAIDQAAQSMTDIQRDLDGLEARAAVVQNEEMSAPQDGQVRDSRASLAQAGNAVSALRLRLAEAEVTVALCRRELEAATSRRTRDAQDLRLSEWIERLPELDEAVANYRAQVAEFWPTLRSYFTTRKQGQAAAERARLKQQDEANRLRLLAQARERAAAATAKRETLEASQGAAAAEVLARLAGAKRLLDRVQQQREQANDERMAVSQKVGGAEHDVERFKETLAEHQKHRGAAIDLLQSFAATGSLATAHQDLAAVEQGAWTATRAVEIARSIEAALTSVDSDDAAWERNQREIHQHIEHLKDALLPHGYSPVTRNTDEGVFVVRVPFQGRECEMVEFQTALAAEIAQHELVLDAREREILENHLVGEVAMHLHDLLHNAEKLVRDMSEELDARPTSTGMKLRFTWQAVDDGPSGLHEARKRLLGAGSTWSQSERAALGEFLQERIKEVRAAKETGTWQEHLTEAFDYRRWHRFGVDRYQDGHWKPLTKKTYGTGSSGEKAIALTLPMLAAAAAIYRSADGHAPRLILLDEAFVSIDPDMRSKCMGLLCAFDLDFVMTSENEWGCYPTLPALAIYHLSTMPGIDAVGVSRWVWNGRERHHDKRLSFSVCAPASDTMAEHFDRNGDQPDGSPTR